MRVRLGKKERDQFFEKIMNRLDKSWSINAAKSCGYDARTIRDWRRGRYTIPIDALFAIAKSANVKIPHAFKKLDDYWYVHKGARLGALRRNALYGSPGTPEGRRKGGLKSIQVNRRMVSPGFNVKTITYPAHSAELAEFIGIILGDGGVTPYQITVTVHRIDDRVYSEHVARIGKKLFSLSSTLSDRKDHNTRGVIFSSKRLVNYFGRQGIPIGNKVRQQVGVPAWIRMNKTYSNACMRGLIDTDGCFYVDKHQYKNRVYYNGAVHFSNHSLPLLAFVENCLKDNGLHPTRKTRHAVFLRREEEISYYFSNIGSSNPKHKLRYKRYCKLISGEVG
jgi:hypothetical protein